MCTAPTVKNMNKHPYILLLLFYYIIIMLLRPIFTRIGPRKSTPTNINDG